MSKRFLTMLASIVALAMLVAGCGGSSGEESLTKAEYVTQGKAVCADIVKEIGASLQTFSKERGLKETATEKQQEEVFEEVIFPGLQVEVERLRELSPPASEEAKVATMLDKLEAGIEGGVRNPDGFLTDFKSPFYKASEMIQDYGLDGCATAF